MAARWQYNLYLFSMLDRARCGQCRNTASAIGTRWQQRVQPYGHEGYQPEDVTVILAGQIGGICCFAK